MLSCWVTRRTSSSRQKWSPEPGGFFFLRAVCRRKRYKNESCGYHSTMYNYNVIVTCWDNNGVATTHHTQAYTQLNELFESWDGLNGRKNRQEMREVKCVFELRAVRYFPCTDEVEVHEFGAYGHPRNYYSVSTTKNCVFWQYVGALGMTRDLVSLPVELVTIKSWEVKPVGCPLDLPCIKKRRERVDSLDLYGKRKVDTMAAMFNNMSFAHDPPKPNSWDGHDDVHGYDTISCEESMEEGEQYDSTVHRIQDDA